MSATLLKAMQMQPKSDNDARLVTNEHRQFETVRKALQAKRKRCHTSCRCDAFHKMLALQLGQFDAFSLRRMCLGT